MKKEEEEKNGITQISKSTTPTVKGYKDSLGGGLTHFSFLDPPPWRKKPVIILFIC